MSRSGSCSTTAALDTTTSTLPLAALCGRPRGDKPRFVGCGDKQCTCVLPCPALPCPALPCRAGGCAFCSVKSRRFFVPGLRLQRRRAQPWSSMAAGHREAGAALTLGRHRVVSSVCEAPISVRERSGQLRPYVRPVTRHSPLAIMGVRVRVRHQSVWRARGTRLLAVLPDFDYRVFPITLLRLPAGSVGFAPVARHPMGSRHPAACATAATPPFGR